MAADKKPVCPQCRTETNIILVEKNAVRAMYKCKACKPYHVFAVSSAPREDRCEPVRSGTAAVEEVTVPKTGNPACRKRIMLVVGLVIIAVAVYILWR